MHRKVADIGGMDSLRHAIRQMISATDAELDALLAQCAEKQVPRRAFASRAADVPDAVFFIRSGLLRVVVTDRAGVDHTVHFAMECDFIADYSGFLQRRPALYSLEAVEDTSLIVLPRRAIEWGYAHMREGERLGRLIAEHYFTYQDHRISDGYARTPRERYDAIGDVFPGIHNRVPQHMIASYLGVTPVHLSRLKRPAPKV